jgi:hypothetical protein
MKKLLLLLFSLALFGKTIDAQYKISFGMFGEVGRAVMHFESNNSSYKISIKASANGIVGALSKHRVEIYESKGIVKNGLLVPKKFIKTRSYDGAKYIKIYKFNHEDKNVSLQKIDTKMEEAGIGFFQDDEEKAPKFITKRSFSKFKYYAKDDILTLFFNYTGNNRLFNKQKITLFAVGGNGEDGRVDIVRFKQNEIAKMQKFLNTTEKVIAKIIINQKIFSSKRGELIVSINKDRVCQKAVLKDVVLFGDIRGKLVQYSVK